MRDAAVGSVLVGRRERLLLGDKTSVSIFIEIRNVKTFEMMGSIKAR